MSYGTGESGARMDLLERGPTGVVVVSRAFWGAFEGAVRPGVSLKAALASAPGHCVFT